MAGSQIGYTLGDANWTNFVLAMEKQRKGLILLSLTNYDLLVGTVPQISQGSVLEVNGALFEMSSGNETIGGAPSANAINYIYAQVAGTDPNQTITFVWSTTAPTWDLAKQGYYNGADRAIGGCYYTGTNYYCKFIYDGIDNGIFKRYVQVGVPGSVDAWGITGRIEPNANFLQFIATDQTQTFTDLTFYLRHGDYVTNFRADVTSYTSAAGGHTLRSISGSGASTAMASLSVNSAGVKTTAITAVNLIDFETARRLFFIQHNQVGIGNTTYTIQDFQIEITRCFRSAQPAHGA